MVNSSAVCGCCTRTDIVREHLEDTLRICDVSAKGLYACSINAQLTWHTRHTGYTVNKCTRLKQSIPRDMYVAMYAYNIKGIPNGFPRRIA
jgi:hypothetical protein